METLAGVLGFYLLAILVGKRTRMRKASTYFIIALIAAAQVAVVMYQLYTKGIPTP